MALAPLLALLLAASSPGQSPRTHDEQSRRPVVVKVSAGGFRWADAAIGAAAASGAGVALKAHHGGRSGDLHRRLVGTATAGATPPSKELREVIPYQFSVECSPYGFAFANDVSGRESLRIETFFDADGIPVRTVIHDAFDESDTNSATGKTLRMTGRRIDTLDLVSGARTVVGKPLLMTDPGSGDVIHDAGRDVFDAPFHVAFEAGRHDGLHDDIDRLACGALAAP